MIMYWFYSVMILGVVFKNVKLVFRFEDCFENFVIIKFIFFLLLIID